MAKTYRTKITQTFLGSFEYSVAGIVGLSSTREGAEIAVAALVADLKRTDAKLAAMSPAELAALRAGALSDRVGA